MTERIGRTCEKHGEWCPNGECRWCETMLVCLCGPEYTYPHTDQRCPFFSGTKLLRLDGSEVRFPAPRDVAVDYAPLPPEVANQVEEFRRWLTETICRGLPK